MASLTAEEQNFLDTVFDGSMSKQEIEDALNWLVAQLITKKPIHINTIGNFRELKLIWSTL